MQEWVKGVSISRKLLGLAFVIGLIVILSALATQYIGGLYPCELCITQRWPYYLGLPLLFIIFLAYEALTSSVRLGLEGLVALLFAYGTGYGIYHAGVERGVFPGPSSCSGAGEASMDLSMLSDFSDVKIVPCDAIQWEMFGITLASLNAIFSAIIVILVVLAIVKHKK